MSITNQALADAIRKEFGKPSRHPESQLGYADSIADFCDAHPAWEPTPGGWVFNRITHRVAYVVGRCHTPNDRWIIEYQSGSIHGALTSDLRSTDSQGWGE